MLDLSCIGRLRCLESGYGRKRRREEQSQTSWGYTMRLAPNATTAPSGLALQVALIHRHLARPWEACRLGKCVMQRPRRLSDWSRNVGQGTHVLVDTTEGVRGVLLHPGSRMRDFGEPVLHRWQSLASGLFIDLTTAGCGGSQTRRGLSRLSRVTSHLQASRSWPTQTTTAPIQGHLRWTGLLIAIAARRPSWTQSTD